MNRKFLLPSGQVFMTAPTQTRAAAASTAAAAFARQGIVNVQGRFAMPGGGLYGLAEGGALPADVVAALHKLAIDVGNSCTEAWNAVESNTGFFSSAWQKMIGSESSASAGKSAANSQCKLAEAVKARVDKIIATDDIAGAQKLLVDAASGNWADVTALKEGMKLLSVSTGVTTVVGDTAKDVATGTATALQKTGEAVIGAGKGTLFIVKYLPYLALGGLALLALSFGRTYAQRMPLPPSQPQAQPVAGFGRRRRRKARRARRSRR